MLREREGVSAPKPGREGEREGGREGGGGREGAGGGRDGGWRDGGREILSNHKFGITRIQQSLWAK